MTPVRVRPVLLRQCRAVEPDLLGNLVKVLPEVPDMVPRVHPDVALLTTESRRRSCAHCLMGLDARQRGVHVPDWDTPEKMAGFTPLVAVCVITQVDGSALELCAQHAWAHLRLGADDD